MIDNFNFSVFRKKIQNKQLSILNDFFNRRLEKPYLSDNLIIRGDSISYVSRKIQEIVPIDLPNELKNKDSINFLLKLDENKIYDKTFDHMKIWRNLEK